MLELAGNAHRGRQVEMADPEQVHAVDGGDGVDVLDAGGRLDQGDEAGAVIGGLEASH